MIAYGTVGAGSLHHPLPPFVEPFRTLRKRWDHIARTALTPREPCRPRLLGGGSCLPAGRVRDRELIIGDNDTPRRVGVLQPLRYPGDVEPLSAAWFSERQTICISQPTRTVPESAAPSRQGYRAARQHPSRYVIGTGLAPRRAAPLFCSVIVRSRRQRYPAQI